MVECLMMLMRFYPAAAAILSQKARLRRFKSRPRSSAYWTLMEHPKNESLFFVNLRTSKKCFFELCHLLRPRIPKQSQFYTIPVLATCEDYRVVGDVFGVHKSAVHKYFHM